MMHNWVPSHKKVVLFSAFSCNILQLGSYTHFFQRDCCHIEIPRTQETTRSNQHLSCQMWVTITGDNLPCNHKHHQEEQCSGEGKKRSANNSDLQGLGSSSLALLSWGQNLLIVGISSAFSSCHCTAPGAAAQAGMEMNSKMQIQETVLDCRRQRRRGSNIYLCLWCFSTLFLSGSWLKQAKSHQHPILRTALFSQTINCSSRWWSKHHKWTDSSKLPFGIKSILWLSSNQGG